MLGIVAVGVVAFAQLGLTPSGLVPGEGGARIASEFFAAALAPATDYEAGFVPSGAPPFLARVAIALLRTLLFAVAAMSLPISVLGVLLIAASVVLFLLELKIVSHGLLTVAGIAALVTGSLILFDGPIPELRVPPMLVIPVSVTISIFVVLAMRMAIRAMRARVATGVEGLESRIATVIQALDPRGKVFVHGETWHAVSRGGAVAEGAQVKIVKVDDMLLTVEPVSGAADEVQR